jgi:hypothetical protein
LNLKPKNSTELYSFSSRGRKGVAADAPLIFLWLENIDLQSLPLERGHGQSQPLFSSAFSDERVKHE